LLGFIFKRRTTAPFFIPVDLFMNKIRRGFISIASFQKYYIYIYTKYILNIYTIYMASFQKYWQMFFFSFPDKSVYLNTVNTKACKHKDDENR